MAEKLNQNKSLTEIDVMEKATQSKLSDFKENVLKEKNNQELIKTKKIIEEGGNTGEIKKLTPELADILLKSDKLYLAALDLSGLTEIDEKVAGKLAGYKGTWIDLSGITEIDEKAAKELSKSKTDKIILDGLSSINVGVAKNLSGFVGTISLNGLTKLDVDTARALAKHVGTLTLMGLTHIDENIIRELAKHNSTINIDEGLILRSLINIDGSNLQHMDEKTIMEFAKYLNSFVFNDYTGTIKKLVEEMINTKLRGLNLTLGLEESVWLINFKNWIKKKYGNKTVEFERNLINKNLSFDKTFIIDGTMLITRKDLQKRVSQCSNDEIMKKIVVWLNN